MTMKTNRTTILVALVTLLTGLLAGWIIFGGHGNENNEIHVHSEDATAETTWTCSMHPQIRQNEPGDCPICGMDLIPLEEDSQENADPSAISMSPTAMQLANISTVVVGGSEPVKAVRLNGKVQPDERLVVSQSSHIPGRIEKLAVNFTGEYIKQGQPIASVYSPQLVTAREELLEAAKIRESQPQLYQAALSKLRNWKLSEQQIEEILRSGNTSATIDILADVSGYVTGKMVNQGDYVERGMAIYEIADLSRVWVLFDVYEQDLPWINRGDKVSFTVSSLPGQTFEGTISWISPVINPATRVARARLEIPNRGLRLKPEMFATGTVESKLDATDGNIVVPKSAVMWTGKRSLVYVKNPTAQGMHFSMREVTLGPSLGNSYIVENGLDEGEEIASSGTFSIDAAAQLSGKPSMMMRPETKTMEVAPEFRKQITDVAYAYFDVKNALVNDSPEAATKAAGKVTATLNQTDMTLLEGKAHDHWMMLLKPMNESSRRIASTNDIEEQREHFNVLSQHIIEMTESFGLEIERAYKQFCPMAFDDQGAFWLSESDEILNPYFGKMMLTCGEVKETFRKGQPVYAGKETANPPAAAGHNH
jgi:membrane fusion protein, copper/silver efflux system